MDGFACRYKVLESGLRHITGFLMPGDLCDFHVTVLGEMDHSVAALSDCVIVDLAPDMIAQLSARPQIQRAFWWTTFVNEAVLRAWLVNIGSRPASQRMAHLLCEWFTRLEAVALTGNGSCPFPLTQEDLGHTLGLSGVHANRTLQQLRRMGLVTVRGKTLTILDLPRLAAFAEFDPSYLRLGMRAQS
jgi:CRP-like cAMP-binding protein